MTATGGSAGPAAARGGRSVLRTVLSVALVVFGPALLYIVRTSAPGPLGRMTAVAWFLPVTAAAFLFIVGMHAGRFAAAVTLVLLVGGPVLITVGAPVEIARFVDDSPLRLFLEPVRELLGSLLPVVIAGALLPNVDRKARLRVRSGAVAVLVGVGGAELAVWLSGQAFRFLVPLPGR